LQFSLQAASPETFGYTLTCTQMFPLKLCCDSNESYDIVLRHADHCSHSQFGHNRCVTIPLLTLSFVFLCGEYFKRLGFVIVKISFWKSQAIGDFLHLFICLITCSDVTILKTIYQMTTDHLAVTDHMYETNLKEFILLKE